MSGVLDENVVILKFDNSDFKKNTADSIKSLNDLKTSLNDKSGADGLERLGSAAKTIDLSGVSKSIDTINHRFSTMGIVGMAAINKLTNSAMSSVANVARAIPNQMIKGGWNRALNIEKAEFLMDGLGKKFEGTYDKLTKKFTGIKGAVLAAVDDTAYGLDEAAKLAATFLASGIEDADELARRLKAVSGVAAVTSSDYASIGRIFAQVAGRGRMMGDDLNQLSDKGFNAAQEIVKYLNANKGAKDSALEATIAAGRQVTAMKEIQKHSKVTEADVRQMVSAGAISFDIMASSLEHFFDTAQKANQTYEGSFANVKASLSRMGAMLEEPKLKNMTRIFNTLLPILKNLEVMLEPFAKKIANASNKVTDFINEGILNPLAEAIGIEPDKLFHGFAKAVEETGDKSKSTGDKVKDLGKKLSVTKKEWQAAMDIWYKGTYGTGQNRADKIRELGMSYEHVQGIINTFYKKNFDWEATRKAYETNHKKRKKQHKEEGKAVEEETKRLFEQTEQLSTLGKVITGVVNFARAFKNVISGVANLFKALTKHGKGLVAVLGGGIMSLFLRISEIVLSLSEKFLLLSQAINGNKEAVETLERDYPHLYSVFNFVSSVLKTVTNAVKTAFGAFRDFFGVVRNYEFITKLTSAIRALISSAFNKLSSIVDKVKGKFRALFGQFTDNNTIGEKLGFFFGKIVDGISNFILALSGAKPVAGSFMAVLGSIANKIIGLFSPVVDFLVDTFFGAIQKIIDFFTAIGNSPGVEALKNQLTDLSDAFSKVEGPLDKFVGSMDGLSHNSSGGGMSKVVEFFSNIAQGLSDFIGAAARGEGPIESLFFSFSRVKSLFSVKGIIDYVKNTIGYNTGKGIGFMVKGLIDMVSNIKRWLVEIGALDKIVHAADVVIGGLGKLSEAIKGIDFNKIFKKIINAPWEKIGKVALYFGSALSMMKMALDMGKVARSAAGMFSSIGGAFKSFGSIANTIKTSIRMKSFETLAISIAILIGAIIALAMIPVDRVKPALAAVGIILGALTAIMFAMTSKKFDAAKLHAVGVAFAGVGAGVMLIATSMMMIAKLKVGDLIKAGVVIGSFMVIIAMISSRAKEMAGTGAAFMGLAVALNLLVTAVMAFAAMPYAVLFKGGGAIFGLMVMLAAAARIANSSKPGGFLAMAVAINLLIPAILLMSLIPISNLVRGGGAIVGLMLALSTAARIADGKGFGALDKVAIVMGVLAAACLVLSFIKPDRLLSAGAAICGMLISLGEAAKISNGAKFTSLLGIIVLLGALVGAIVALDRLAPDRAVEIALSLSAMVVAIGGIIAVFNALHIGPGDAAKAAGAFDIALGIIVGGVAAIMAIFAAIEKACDKLAGSDGATQRFMERGVEMLKTVRKGMDALFGANTKELKADPTVQSFVDMINGVNKLLNSVKDMKLKDLEKFGKLAKAMNDLGAANMEDSIAKMLGGGSMDIGVQINNFAAKLVDFVNKVKEIDKGDLKQAQLAADIFGTFAHGAAEMPAQGGLAVFGSFKSLTWFGLQMSSFASVLPGFIKTMDQIPKEKLAGLVAQGDYKNSKLGYIMDLVRSLNTLQGELNASGGLDQLKSGNTTLSEFGNQIGGTEGFAKGIHSFLDEVNLIPKEKLAALFAEGKYENSKIGYIGKMVRYLNKLQSELNPSGGFEQFKSGNTTLGEFANDLSGFTGFGVNIGKFINELDAPGMDLMHLELAAEKIKPIADVVREIGSAGAEIPPSGGAEQFLNGCQDIGVFGSQMAQFAIGFKSLFDTLNGVEINDPEAFKIKIDAIADASKALAKIKPPTEGFFEALSMWAQFHFADDGIATMIRLVKKVGKAEVPEDISDVCQRVADASDNLSTIKPPSEGFFDALKKWVTAKIDSSSIQNLVDTINDVADAGDDINTAGVAKFSTATSTIKSSIADIRGLGTIPTAATLPTLANNVQKFADKMSKISTANIVKNAQQTVRAANKLKELDGASSGIEQAASSMASSGKSIASSIGSGISSGVKSVTSAAKGLVKAAKGAIDTGGLRNTGAMLAAGFAAGMRSCQAQVLAAAAAMEAAAERAVKAKAKVKSPSRVFMEIGAYIGEGFVIGLSSYNDKVYKAGGKMAQQSVDAANEAVRALDLYGNPTITPVLDLSEVRRGANELNAMVSQTQALAVNANVNSAVSNYATPWMVGSLLDKLNEISTRSLDVTVKNDKGLGAQITNNITVDGSENPEDFANRFVRQLEMEMRTM